MPVRLSVSTVQSPAPSTPEQLHAEATAIATVAYSHCPIHAVLDRIVISHTGTIMALWQVGVVAMVQAFSAFMWHLSSSSASLHRSLALLW